jgi:hypothetical protein
MANKKTLTKLTFDELIARKLQKDKDRLNFKEIEVPSYGGTLTFERPLDEDLIPCIDEAKAGGGLKDALEAYDKIIYTCCPMLKDPKLHEQFGVKNPLDIVKTLFDMNDRLTVGNELMEFSGITGLADKIKN